MYMVAHVKCIGRNKCLNESIGLLNQSILFASALDVGHDAYCAYYCSTWFIQVNLLWDCLVMYVMCNT